MKVDHTGVRTWVEVDTRALNQNYKTFRHFIGHECKLMAVAKSNAYGHGLVDYSRTMQDFGVDWIGVDSITEALKLRREGIFKPILVLGFTLTEKIFDAYANNISITLSNFEQFKEIESVKELDWKLKVHVKIDTGMHRQGFLLEDLNEVFKKIKKAKNIEVEGIYTHFAAAKNPAFPAGTRSQIMDFQEAVKIAHEYGFKPIRHASATGGALLFPESNFDMVRIGIGLYGIWTSAEARSFAENRVKLEPILSWRTIITEIKKLDKGEAVSYDLTERVHRNSRIAILPIGYWNGFRRCLSSVGHVLINGQRAKVLGRITMDMAIIDITDISDVKVGDVVTLIGKDGREEITVEELTSYYDGGSVYETITTLNPLMKRIYL